MDDAQAMLQAPAKELCISGRDEDPEPHECVRSEAPRRSRLHNDLRSHLTRSRTHIKAIFEKTGVRTRGELSATLFFGEHLERIRDLVPVGDDAWFIDAPRPRGTGT